MSDRTNLGPAIAGGNRDTRYGEISFLALVNMLLRHRWLFVLLPGLLLVLAMAYSLTRPRTYSSVVSFVPQTAPNATLGQFAGVAAQLGLGVSTLQTAPESPAFYQYLVQSNAILDSAVSSEYSLVMNDERVSRDLVRYLVEDEDVEDGPLARTMAVEALRRRLDVGWDRETSVVTVIATTESADLSEQIARRLIQLVNSFNLERRTTQAATERAFIAERLEEAAGELRKAETSLQGFLKQNRQFANSPELVFEHDRLERVVGLRQEVYASLAQAYEHARIEEVRNLPVITVIQPPTVPARPNPRGTVVRGLLAIAAGLAVALLIALSRELTRHRPVVRDQEALEFAELRRQTIRDLRNPIRGLARVVSGR